MKLVLDFLTLILFFGVYFLSGNIYWATGVAIIGGMVQAAYSYWTDKKLDVMQTVNLVVIVFFGGATLFFHDESWIKWKPTILYWLFALILGSGLLVQRNFLKALVLSREIMPGLTLPDLVWSRLAWGWTLFFAAVGMLNLWVAFNFTLSEWVTFKAFGSPLLLLFFFIGQACYVYRYLPAAVTGKKSS